MVYDPHYFQLRETQLKRMLAIVEQTKDAQPGGVVFFGDSLTEIYPLEESYSVDVFPQFVAADGEALTEFYQDGLHLNEKGFERLTALLKPEILKLLGE